MRAITFCLFSFTVFSQLTTCSNSTNCYTSLFFFFFASSFTATLHQTCWKALHLKSCIVDRSYVLFVILSIVVLYEFLCKHCFISRDCYIARSIFLFYTAAFAKGVLFPTSHYFFFFFGFAMPDLGYTALGALFFSLSSETDSSGWPASPRYDSYGQCRRCHRATPLSVFLFTNFALHLSLAEASMSHHGRECICSSDSTDVHFLTMLYFFFRSQ